MALTINGTEISDSLIQQEFARVKGHYEQMLQVECCERDPEFIAEAKAKLKKQVLLSQEAKRSAVKVENVDVESALKKLYEENGGKDRYLLELGLRLDQEDQLKRSLSHDLVLEKFIDNYCRPKPQWSEEDQRLFYQENIKSFYCEEKVKASHVSKTREGISSMDEAYEDLRAVRKEILTGADFDEMATKHNNDTEMDVDLGFFKRGEFIEQFETVAFSMETGEISPIFATHLGLHICKVTDRIDSAPTPFPKAQTQVEELMSTKHREDKLDAVVAELEEKAVITDTDPEGKMLGGH